jgi:epoxyqueuosine reductase
MNQSLENAEWIERSVKDFIGKSPENTLNNQNNDHAFEMPLVGFSNGNDHLYKAYKEYVGPFHLTPREIFNVTFMDLNINPEDLMVISWVLPHNTLTKTDNQKEAFYPSECWARGRIFGEEINVKLRKHMVRILEKKGYKAIAPALTPQMSIFGLNISNSGLSIGR